MDNAFFRFLAEFVTRLFSSKPKFFAIIQWIAFITGGVSSAILYLQSITTLPSWVAAPGNVTVIIVSFIVMV